MLCNGQLEFTKKLPVTVIFLFAQQNPHLSHTLIAFIVNCHSQTNKTLFVFGICQSNVAVGLGTLVVTIQVKVKVKFQF